MEKLKEFPPDMNVEITNDDGNGSRSVGSVYGNERSYPYNPEEFVEISSGMEGL